MSDERRFFNESTARLAERVDEAMNWYSTLHEIYVELAHREKAAAKELRAELAEYFQRTGSYFPWPTTIATPGAGEMPGDAFEHETGVLGYMGYKVGKSGAAKGKRQALLEDAYLGHLPFVNSAEYMAKWGKPKSAKRLERMAISIAEFAKARKKSDSKKYAKAILDWESDLEYLRESFYEGRYSFHWPESAA